MLQRVDFTSERSSLIPQSSEMARKHLARARTWIANGFPPIDFQMHTTWTDGSSSVAEMIAAARHRNLDAIAITEHVNSSSTYYPAFREEIVRLRHKCNDVEVFYGIEVSIADYKGRLRTALRRPEDTELVLGVVHSYPKASGGYHHFGDLTPEQALACEIDGLMALAANPLIDIIGHPGGTYFKKFGAFPVEYMEPVFRLAAKTGVAVEVNSSYCWDLYGLLAVLEATNPVLSFGSDAHTADDVGTNCSQLQPWFKNRAAKGAA